MEDLHGRRVVITGASRGIGAVIARQLAEQGARIVAIARRRSALDSLVGQLIGGPHEAHAFDVADEQAWRQWSSGDDGPVHGLVTAAGIIGPIGPIGTWDVGAFRTTLDVNVVGTLLAVRHCLDRLRSQSGSVVTLSGGGATSPLPRFDAYATSKAAVARLSENLARDLEPSEVRVNSVAPGFIVTEMHDATIAAGPELVGQSYFDRTKRAVESGGGDPPGLAADLTAFLLSPGSAGITGKLISARWDPWGDAGFQERLRSDVDFCTVRRIDAQFFDRSTDA